MAPRPPRRSPPVPALHDTASARLRAMEQRYTANRRAIVDVLGSAARPLTMAEIVARTTGVPKSSAYRNLTVLCEAGVARRLTGDDDSGRYELAEELAGHHHHLRCLACGAVMDFSAPAPLEQALLDAARRAGDESGFEITGHRVDFEGHCPSCRAGAPPFRPPR